MGNTDNDLDSPEYRGRLGAALLEAQMGKVLVGSWSSQDLRRSRSKGTAPWRFTFNQSLVRWPER